MQRKWVLVAVGIAVVAAALLGGQELLNRRPASAPGTSTTGGTAAGDSGAGTSTTSSAAAGSAGGNTTNPSNRRPSQPAPQALKPVPATGAASAGSALHPLSTSPSRIIAGFSIGKAPSGAVYSIRFRPWGYGPGDRRGRTVAVQIISAASLGGAKDIGGLKGVEMLLVMDDKNSGVVYSGGTYSGLLTFVQDGSRLVPTLSVVEPSQP